MRKDSQPASAERRLKDLGIELPAPPEPFGTYVEAVQTGNLLFLTGMLPTEGRAAKFVGRIGGQRVRCLQVLGVEGRLGGGTGDRLGVRVGPGVQLPARNARSDAKLPPFRTRNGL